MNEPYSIDRWFVHTEESVSSTQKWMKDRVTILHDRSVILAGAQTSGRGRMGRCWKSPTGGFYASFLLKPSPPPAHAPCVSLLAAVVLSRILSRHGIPVQVKWPNDVIAGGRKIAGIIAEAGSSPESWFILGMGINLAGAPSIPERKFLPAGSWADFGKPPSAEELLQKFITEMDKSWFCREESPVHSIEQELDTILWRKNKPVTLTGGEEKIRGTVMCIAPDGSLVLQTDSGERRFVSGELLTVSCERGKDD